jgi:hypothetical protein
MLWRRRESAAAARLRGTVEAALLDYPVYDPPHRQSANFPRQVHGEDWQGAFQDFKRRSEENFQYFKEQRPIRLAAFGTFLSKFEVPAGVDDMGLAAVSAWCPNHCGFLVRSFGLPTSSRNRKFRFLPTSSRGYRHKFPPTWKTFFELSAPWDDQWHGLNAVFDLGVYLGECIIARNPKLYWWFKAGASDDGAAIHSGYQIGGFARERDCFDPMMYAFTTAITRQSLSRRSFPLRLLIGVIWLAS